MKKKMKVLFVDDEPDFINVMRMRVRSWGYEFLSAPDGQKALETLKSGSPDVIVLDYLMPIMNGVETLKAIRKINPKVPVIMMTAYPDEKIIEGATSLGVHAFIPKISDVTEPSSSLETALKMIEKKLGKD